jgi:predicted dehydrogenase
MFKSLSPGPESSATRTDDDVNLAVVGLGYWGPNLLRVLYEMEGVNVAAICDLDADRLERFGRRYPSVHQSRNYEAILRDPEIDGVVLATPVYTHFDLASRALHAGKHVFVEKPLAPSTEQADALLNLANANGLGLMCGHTFVYSPPVRAVKDLIDNGELGDIYFISASRVNLGLHQRDVSVLWDLGPHDFSILLYWLGEAPESVSATGRDSVVKGIPDVAFVNMSFPSGILAHIELSWLAPSKLRRTVVVGSEKMVVYDDSSPEPIRIFDHGVVYEDPETFGQYHLSYRTGDVVSPKLDATEPIALEMVDFVMAVRTGCAPAGHAALARGVVQMVEAAENSLARGGRPAFGRRGLATAYG